MTGPNTPTPTDVTPQLPALETGLQLLDTDPDLDRAVHALAVDHVLRSGGSACWSDPGSHARSGPLVDLAPSDRILDRFRVARAFTPFQHLELLATLPETISARTELLVVPALDGYYRDDDLLGDEGLEMLLAGIAALAGLARDRDLPVLVTRRRDDGFAEPIERAATRTIRCESTPFGPRFRSVDEETFVYPNDGGWVQTTLAFWEQVLAARAPSHRNQERHTGEVLARGTN